MSDVKRAEVEGLVIDNLKFSCSGKLPIFESLGLSVQPGEFLLGDNYADPSSLVL